MAIENDKVIYFIRHGLTEMNEILHKIGWANPDFVDCDLWDTRLSRKGIEQTIALHHEWSANCPINWNSVDIILASPLSRAMETANILFGFKHQIAPSRVPRVAHPILRERLFMSSDVGRCKKDLEVDFPGWDLNELPNDKPWWFVHESTSQVLNEKSGNMDIIHCPYVEWRPPGKYSCEGEPTGIFRRRLREVKSWLLSRPETTMVVVVHWGIIRGLTGLDVRNCEVVRCVASDLLEEPFVDDY
jgi:broad specificity phosphatase PhoE